MEAQRQSKESPKMRGSSDKSNLDKLLQTSDTNVTTSAAKRGGMKMLNELFERDVHLREAMDAESLHRWTDLTYQKEKEITGMG